MIGLRPTTRFEVPPDRWAVQPPEARGIARDQVRLLVARPGRLDHVRAADLDRFLDPGDLLVVNTSATRPAAIDGLAARGPVVVHLATEHPDGTWTVELRRPDGAGPVLDAAIGDAVALDGGGHVRLGVPAATGPGGVGVRLWRATVAVPGRLRDHMAHHGRPISYGEEPTPLEAHQTVFARHPGSAEMPSAARPFTADLVTRLVSRGVVIAPITLHAGVSSQEAGEAPQPEWADVPASTAAQVRLARRLGRRVVAVGTTVVRALESAVDDAGVVQSWTGWADLVVTPDHPVRAVTGLLSGWHEAEASHLLLLEAVAGAELVSRAYAAAVEGPYLWHAFGDSCLLLPDG